MKFKPPFKKEILVVKGPFTECLVVRFLPHPPFRARDDLILSPTWFCLQEATEGRGVDVVVEMLANVNLQSDMEMLATGGTVAVSLSDKNKKPFS